MGQSNKCTMSEFAKENGLALKDVKELINTGILKDAVVKAFNNRKLLLRALAYQLYQNHKMQSAGFAPDKVEENTQKASPGSGYRDGSVMINDETREVYSKSRAAKEAIAAKTAQIKYEQLAGSLVDADEVRAAFKVIGLNIKNALLNIPNKLSPIVTAETDVAENKRTLTKEIKEVLDNLSRGDYDFLKEDDEALDEISVLKRDRNELD